MLKKACQDFCLKGANYSTLSGLAFLNVFYAPSYTA